MLDGVIGEGWGVVNTRGDPGVGGPISASRNEPRRKSWFVCHFPSPPLQLTAAVEIPSGHRVLPDYDDAPQQHLSTTTGSPHVRITFTSARVYSRVPPLHCCRRLVPGTSRVMGWKIQHGVSTTMNGDGGDATDGEGDGRECYWTIANVSSMMTAAKTMKTDDNKRLR